MTRAIKTRRSLLWLKRKLPLRSYLGQLSETHQKDTYHLSWRVIAFTVKIFTAACCAEI